MSRDEFVEIAATSALGISELLRGLSKPAPPAAPPPGLARTQSAGLVRTKSVLAAKTGMSKEELVAIQRLLPTFTCLDLHRLLPKFRAGLDAGAPMASLLEELRAAGAGAPAAFEQATIFFELLFARAEQLGPAELPELFGMLVLLSRGVVSQKLALLSAAIADPVSDKIGFGGFMAFVHAANNIKSALEQWSAASAALSPAELSQLPDHPPTLQKLMSSFEPRVDEPEDTALAEHIFMGMVENAGGTTPQLSRADFCRSVQIGGAGPLGGDSGLVGVLKLIFSLSIRTD